MFPCRPRSSWLLVLTALIVACSKPIDPGTPIAPAAAPTAEPSGVAWVHAASDADVDAAFAHAKAANVPVFLYWGATWCPPCNQVKATAAPKDTA
jgi:thiol:disulfide interchange protein